jgi:hypothetical protein
MAAQHFGCVEGVLLDLALALPIWKESCKCAEVTEERAQALTQPYRSRRMPW